MKTVIDEFCKQGGAVYHLAEENTRQTLLHRILCKTFIDMEMLKELLKLVDENYICKTEQIDVGGKLTERSVLHLASEKGHIEAAKLIINSIKNHEKITHLLNKTTTIKPEGQRPRPLYCLHIAAKCGHNDLVRYFIEHCKMPVNLANAKGDTPILWAANDNKPDTVELLIELGADVNAKNDKGSSALHWACRNGYTSVVKVLVSKSNTIDVNIERSLGLVCPLIAASAMGFLEIVALLINHGADLEKRMGGGQTAIHLAAAEGHLNIVMKLLEHGADSSAVDAKGNNALIHAAAHGHYKVVIFLGEYGGDFSHKNLIGQTVWDFALEQGNLDLIKALTEFVLKKPLTAIDTHDSDSLPRKLPPSITILHSAAAIGNESVIRQLSDMNIDMVSRDSDDMTFLHTAVKNNQRDIITSFADKQLCAAVDAQGYTALHYACEYGYDEAISALLPHSDLKTTNNYKQTVLHLAVKSIDVTESTLHALVTQMILHYDWNVLHTRDEQKRTALHVAVVAGNTAAIPNLNQLSPDSPDLDGNTPVHLAVINGHHEILELLIKAFSSMGKAINLDLRNEDGDTALHIVARTHDHNMCRTLIKAGADLAVLNEVKGGVSMLHSLAHQIAKDPENLLRYMTVLNAVHESVIYWWCRRVKKSIPNKQDSRTIKLYRKEALLFLYNEVTNDNGLSVLQLSARIPAKEMILAILNTEDVFMEERVSTSEVIYDVTNLLPSTSTWREESTYQKKRNKISVTPEDPTGNDVDELVLDAAKKTLAEYLTEVENSHEVANILDVSPFKNLVQSYWERYQKAFAGVFLIHILVMSVYCYCGITYIGCPTASSNVTGTQQDSLRPWGAELGISLGLIWPALLILYNFIWLVQTIRAGLKKSFIEFWSHSDSDLGAQILQLCGFLYSVMSVSWFIMNRLCADYQDYILALSFLFGWIYGISFTSGFKNFHHFSVILQYILLKDMVLFSFIYIFILLAFSFAYAALVQPIPALKISGGSSLFLVFNWMVGMGDFEANADDFAAENRSNVFVEIVYSLYIILSTIALLNLLIAMMNDSYAEIRQRSEVMWKVRSLKLPLQFEKNYLGGWCKSLASKPKGLLLENDRWFLVVHEDKVVPYKLKTSLTLNDLRYKIDAMNENLDNLKTSFNRVQLMEKEAKNIPM